LPKADAPICAAAGSQRLWHSRWACRRAAV